MPATKTKSLQTIENRLEGLEEGSLRHATLLAAREFKLSWIGLGQKLYQVYRQKSFKEWGYLSFDGYVTKEIGIRPQTANKLLKSYLFLEREEPLYIRTEAIADEARRIEGTGELPGTNIPSYEAVNTLRLAKGKVSEEEYGQLRHSVFEEGREGKEVRKSLQSLIRQKEPADPEKERAARRKSALSRLIRTMKSIGEEASHAKFLPKDIIKQISDLAAKIEAEIE